MEKIMVISPMEYGTQIDHKFWCKYLKRTYNIIHLSYGNEYYYNKNGNLEIIKLKNTRKFRKIKLVLFSNKLIKNLDKSDSTIIVDYFPGCSLIKILNLDRKIILDIRTGTIKNNIFIKKIRDFLIKFESTFFNNITIISYDLGKKLKLNQSKLKLLPLGSDKFLTVDEIKNKSVEKLNVLYVGTFIMRNIENTIEAMKKLKNIGYEKKIKYTLIGAGKDEEYNSSINELIKLNGLENMIEYVGRVEHSELKKYFKKNNIGLSYIPITEYFDVQPPTKTFEYIINGLFCVATNTSANREIINEKNGILIGDSVEEIVKGIEKVYKILINIDLYNVSKTLDEFTWENIVNNKMKNIINDIGEKE